MKSDSSLQSFESRLALLYLQWVYLKKPEWKPDPGPTPSRLSRAVWTDVAVWLEQFACAQKTWPPGTWACEGLESKAGFSRRLYVLWVLGNAGCLLIIKAVFMTSLKENKKGKDPSAYSFRPGMKAWPLVPLGMARSVALENKTRDACSGKREALKLEAKQEQLSWMPRPLWPDVTAHPARPRVVPSLPQGLCGAPGCFKLLNKGRNKQAQDPRTPQCLSQRKTQPCSAHNQPFMGASDTRKIKAGNMLLPLKISLWWFKTLNQVWLEQKHFCLFRLLRPWNWHGAEKYFLHGNFYFLVGICILG